MRLPSNGRAIVDAFGDLDGVRYNSRFAGDPRVELFMAAQSAMPMQPWCPLPLTHPDVGSRLAAAPRRIGYRVI